MGILSDFFIADRSTVPVYNGGEEFDEADKCQFKGLSPLQCAQFLAVLRDQEYCVSIVSEFRLVTPEDAEDWTMTVPQDMVDKLAALSVGQIAEVSAQFANATREELGWSPDDFVPIVTQLQALSRRALERDKSLYLWNCI